MTGEKCSFILNLCCRSRLAPAECKNVRIHSRKAGGEILWISNLLKEKNCRKNRIRRNLVSVNNAKSVQIFTLDGIMVDNQPSVDGFYQTTLSNGLYLIKADNNVSKVVVK